MKMNEKIEEILDRIRPALELHGGDVELLEVKKNGTVMVRFSGVCSNCAISELTLKHLIEREIKRNIPKVKRVIAEML